MANSSSGESVLQRCVRVLEAFDVDTPALTVTQISKAAELPVSTTHRLVGEMVECGLLDRRGAHTLVMGQRAWELVNRTHPLERLRFRAHPVMESIHSAVFQFVCLAVPDFPENQVLFIDYFDRFGEAKILANQAGRMDLFDNSMGLALLAFASSNIQEQVLARPMISAADGRRRERDEVQEILDEARARGFVKLVGGLVADNTAYAIPLLGSFGQPVASLAVVGRTDQLDENIILPMLSAAGKALSHGDLPLRVPTLRLDR